MQVFGDWNEMSATRLKSQGLRDSDWWAARCSGDLILRGRGRHGQEGCENSSPRESCRCKTGGRPPPPAAVTRKLEVSYTGAAAPHLHIRTP